MIELKNIYKTYASGPARVQALRGVSLRIALGEFVAIMGPSGSGKSTLMHMMGVLDKPDSGEYYLEKVETTKLSDDELAVIRNRLVGFVFQQFHLMPRMTALANAELPLIYGGKRHLKEKAREKIEEVGLAERSLHRPSELSGGEQQRVAIARSLVNEPLIILADEPTGNLDTKSEEEIMAILKQLNEKGKTVIIVTHEKEIAAYAKRIIMMRDGKIISDETMDKKIKSSISEAPVEAVKNILSESRRLSGQAKFMDYIGQSVYAALLHKMRTFLSILGILIGVAAVIAMLALGQGAKEAIKQQLAWLGSNLLLVMPGSQRLQGVALEAGAVTRFTFQDVAEISKLTAKVRKVSPSANGRGQLVYADKNWNTRIEGVGVDYAQMRAAVPTTGRFFTEEELRIRSKVALLGTTVARELFGDVNPLGATIKINLINFKVIGVLPQKGASTWRDQDDVVIIPITTAMYRLLGKEYIDSIFVEVIEPGLLEETQKEISKVIIKQHHLNKDNEDSFQVRNMADIKEAFESTTRTMALLLGSIAAISLLVGGIGIMNIMLVSVTERTREIGIRMAIGARTKDILWQFLTEAVLLTMLGGVIGIALGAGGAMIVSKLLTWPTLISIQSIVIAFFFSGAVGIFFGFYPARKAAGLNPIEALRYE